MPTSSLPPLKVIGVVQTQFQDRGHTPIQAALNPDDEGVVVLEERYSEALEGLQSFDYLWLLTWLGEDPQGEPALRQVPFLLQRDGREMGILATRGPRRINPIGLSLVRLVGINGLEIRFAGVDLLDGTPVVDIKPFVARFDRPSGAIRSGWFDTVPIRRGDTPARLRPSGWGDRSPGDPQS